MAARKTGLFALLFSFRLFVWGVTGLASTLALSNCANRYEEPELLALLAGRSAETPAILILGDSLTEYSRGFGLAELLAGRYRVFWKGAPNRDIPYWTQRLPEALSLETALPLSALVFPMGTNDAYLYGPPQFRANLMDFHKFLRFYTSAHVYYAKVPRTQEASLQTRVLANNAALPELISSIDNASLVDLDAAFEERLLSLPLYPPSDPIHPNETGYRLIGESIRQAILATPPP